MPRDSSRSSTRESSSSSAPPRVDKTCPCGCPIVRLINEATGKRVPLDTRSPVYRVIGPDSCVQADQVFVSHFRTCPKVVDFAKATPAAQLRQAALDFRQVARWYARNELRALSQHPGIPVPKDLLERCRKHSEELLA